MKRMVEPYLADFVDVSALAAAAREERLPAPVRLAGDVAGSATAKQVQTERIRRDLADRLGLPAGEAT